MLSSSEPRVWRAFKHTQVITTHSSEWNTIHRRQNRLFFSNQMRKWIPVSYHHCANIKQTKAFIFYYVLCRYVHEPILMQLNWLCVCVCVLLSKHKVKRFQMFRIQSSSNWFRICICSTSTFIYFVLTSTSPTLSSFIGKDNCFCHRI